MESLRAFRLKIVEIKYIARLKTQASSRLRSFSIRVVVLLVDELFHYR